MNKDTTKKRRDFDLAYREAVSLLFPKFLHVRAEHVRSVWLTSMSESEALEKDIVVHTDEPWLSLGVLAEIKNTFGCRDVLWSPIIKVAQVPDTTGATGWIIKLMEPSYKRLRRAISELDTNVLEG